jgi:hypothetical protein
MRSITSGRNLDFENRIKDLEEQIKENEQKRQELQKQKKEEFSLAQQLLVLHYVGFFNNIDASTKAKSTLLSKILNKSFDNIKKQIPYLNSPKISHSEIKNVVNLEVVWKLFNDLKMSEVADKVMIDLNKIKEI